MTKNTIIKNMGLSILLSASVYETHGAEQQRREHDGMVIGDRQLRVGDTESSMDGALNDQIMKCFTVIYNNIPTLNETAVENAYDQVIDFVNSPDKRDKERPKPKIVQNINGEFVVTGEGQLLADILMYINALKTLTYTGFRGSIATNAFYVNCPTKNGEKTVMMKELLARVWLMINSHANPLHVGLMKDNLFANLNYCVEDNGHLTCDDGKTKRLISSIEGYFHGISLTAVLPDPAGFCSQYSLEFFANLEAHDPINIMMDSFAITDNFSLEDLENRIVREREVVRLRINGLYGAETVKANTAIRLMEGYFDRWREIYNENAPSTVVNIAPSNPVIVPVPSVEVDNVDVPVIVPVSANADAEPDNLVSPDQARLTELLQMIEDVGYETFVENQDLVSELERLMPAPVLNSVTAVPARGRPQLGAGEEQRPEVIIQAEVAAQEVLDAETRAQGERMRNAAAQLNAQPANPNRPVRERPSVQQPGILRQTAAWPAMERPMFEPFVFSQFQTQLQETMRRAREAQDRLDEMNRAHRERMQGLERPMFEPIVYPQFNWQQTTTQRPSAAERQPLPTWQSPVVERPVIERTQPVVERSPLPTWQSPAVERSLLPTWPQSLFQSAVQQLTPKQAKAAQKAEARQAKRIAAQEKKAQRAEARQAKRIAAQEKKAQKVEVRQAKRFAAQMRKAQKIATQQAKKAAAQILKAEKAAQKAAQRLAARHGIAV